MSRDTKKSEQEESQIVTRKKEIDVQREQRADERKEKCKSKIANSSQFLLFLSSFTGYPGSQSYSY